MTHEVCLGDGDPPLAPLSAALAAASSPALLPGGSPGLAGSSPGFQQHHGADTGLLALRLDAAELQPGGGEERAARRRRPDKGPAAPPMLAQAAALGLGPEQGGATGTGASGAGALGPLGAQGAQGALGAPGALGARALASPLALPRAPTAAGAAALSVLIPPSSDASGRLVEELRQFGQPQKKLGSASATQPQKKPGNVLPASPGFGPKGPSAGASAPPAGAGGGAGPGLAMKQRQQSGAAPRASSAGGVAGRPPMVHHFGASGEYHPIPAVLLQGGKDASPLGPAIPPPAPSPGAAMHPAGGEEGAAQGGRAGKGGAPGPLSAGPGLPPSAGPGLPGPARRLKGPKGVPISSPLLAGLARPGLAAAPRAALSSPPISSTAARMAVQPRRVPVPADPPASGPSAHGGAAPDAEGGPQVLAADGASPAVLSSWAHASPSSLSSPSSSMGLGHASQTGGTARPPPALSPASQGAGSPAWPYADGTLLSMDNSVALEAPKPTPSPAAQGPS